MELRQLEHFVAVAEERHFSRAAARVHVVQSSISASVGRLEAELGDRLFVRDAHRVLLTASGEALLPAARAALEAAGRGRDAVAAVRGLVRGHLRIGVIQALDTVDLPALLRDFRVVAPAVTFELVNDAVDALIAQVRDGTLDFAFVDSPFDARGLALRELGEVPLVLAVATDHPLAMGRTARLPALAGETFVDYRSASALHASIESACASVGLTRTVAGEADTMAAVCGLVAAGVGVAILPAAAVAGAAGVVALSIAPAIPQRFSVVTPEARPTSPAAAALLARVSSRAGVPSAPPRA